MALDAEIQRLAAIPLLAGLDIEALRLIAFSAETRILRTGDLLFSKGEPSNGGFVVVSGMIALEFSDDGRIAPQTVGPDALIGELALITETERPATALASQPSVVRWISRALFHRVLQEFPGSAARLQATIESRLLKFGALAQNFDGHPNLKA